MPYLPISRAFRTIASFVALLILVHGTSYAQRRIKIAAGSKHGNYYKLARAIADAVRRDATVEILETHGSVENIQRLESGSADFAFVQSDIAQRASRGDPPFEAPLNQLRIATPLFTEAVQVLVRSDLFVFGIDELRGKIISLGPEGGGVEDTATAVLEASGLSIKEFDAAHSTLEATDRDLRRRAIDVAFLVSAVPTEVVRDALYRQDARLLFLDGKGIDRLVRTRSYIATSVPKDTYPNQLDEVPTVGVEALLMVREDTNPDDVSFILQLLASDRKEIAHAVGVSIDFLGREGPPNLSIPFHPEAKKFLRRDRSPTLILLAVGILAFSLVLLTLRKRPHIRRSLAGYEQVLLAMLVLILVWAAGAGGLFYFERHVNESFETLPRSLWSMLVYVSGGFQERRPITPNGQVVAVLATVSGVGVISWFIASMADRFVRTKLDFLEHLILGRNMLPKNLTDHIVVVNWDRRAEKIVKQLHGPDFLQKRPIVLMSSLVVKFPSIPEFDNTFSIRGEPTDNTCLDEARIRYAHSVTILSAWPNSKANEPEKPIDSDSADAKTTMAILSIRATCKEGKDGDDPVALPITAEIKSRTNLEIARKAGLGGPTEIICLEDFGAELFTQCAYTPGLADIYTDLLTFSPGTSEIYKVPLPKNCVGKTFAEVLCQYALARKNGTNDAVPIAVCRGQAVHLNPKSCPSTLKALSSSAPVTEHARPSNVPKMDAATAAEVQSKKKDLGPLCENDFLFVIADHDKPSSD